jgi:hypothetical protein
MRATLGTSACNSSSRFAPSKLPPKNVTPVRLPCGRFRLGTRPIFTGSSPTTKTIGTVELTALIASSAGVLATITPTFRLTRSAARPGSRSG